MIFALLLYAFAALVVAGLAVAWEIAKVIARCALALPGMARELSGWVASRRASR